MAAIDHLKQGLSATEAWLTDADEAVNPKKSVYASVNASSLQNVMISHEIPPSVAFRSLGAPLSLSLFLSLSNRPFNTLDAASALNPMECPFSPG